MKFHFTAFILDRSNQKKSTRIKRNCQTIKKKTFKPIEEMIVKGPENSSYLKMYVLRLKKAVADIYYFISTPIHKN